MATEDALSLYRLDYIDSGAHGIATHRITGASALRTDPP